MQKMKALTKESNLYMKLALGIVALSLLGMVTIFVVVNTAVRTAIYDNALTAVEREATIHANILDDWFREAVITLESLNIALTAMSSEDDFESIIVRMVEETDFITNIFIGFADGRVINGLSWVPYDSWNLFDRPWYIAAVEAGEGEIVRLDAFWAHSSQTVAMAISEWLPELGDSGAVVGVSIALDYFLTGVNELDVAGDGYMILVGADRGILAHPNPYYSLGPDFEIYTLYDIANGHEIIAYLEAGTYVARMDDEIVGSAYFIATPLYSVPWTLITIIPTEAIDRPIFQSLLAIMAALALVFLALFAFIMFIASSLIKSAETSREKELKITERWLAIYAAAPIGVCFWNESVEMLDCNEALYKMFELSSSQEYIERASELWADYQPSGLPSGEEAAKSFEKVRENGYNRDIWMCKDIRGKEFPVDMIQVGTMDGENLRITTYVIDLRPFREFEEKDRAKSRFLARMSHELRTPLTAVLGISEVELQKRDLPHKTEEAFARIHSSATLLLRLVNDILDLSKLESGKMEITAEEYDLSSLINDSAQLHTLHLDHKNIKFELHIDDQLPSRLIGDALRIRQIINNLTSNAFKYTDEGTVSLAVGFEHHTEDRIMLVVSVRDTGHGMSEEQLEELKTSEYSRFHEEVNRSVYGTGLGISIVYSLLQIMEGSVDFQSEVGKGTEVLVKFPQKICTDNVLGKEVAENLQNFEFDTLSLAEKNKIELEPMPYGKVLVVDDVDTNLFVARGLLDLYGISTDTCANGQEALDAVNAGKEYDIIFMDYLMPGLNGTETMRLMRNAGYSSPIVVLTANAFIDQAEEFLNNGFDDFISKPIQSKRLNEVLIKYVRDKQPPEVIAAARENADGRVDADAVDGFLKKPKIAEKLRVDFKKTYKNTLNQMIGSIDEGDLATAHRLAHTLKGVAGLIAEDALMKAAADVESILRDEKEPDESKLLTLENEFSRVIENIVVDKDAEPSEDMSMISVTELLDGLEPLLNSHDVQALSLLDGLRTIPAAAILVWQIEDMDFAKASASLEALRSILDA